MLQAFFHAWERRLASATKDRVVRPFEWGLDWHPANGHQPGTPPQELLRDFVAHAMADTDRFFTPPPTTDYTLTGAAGGDVLPFPSAVETPHRADPTEATPQVHLLSVAGAPGRPPRRSRPAAMERRPGRPRRPVPHARVERAE